MRRPSTASSRLAVAIIAMLFFALRFVWAPIHVAHEHHAHFAGHVLPEAARGAAPHTSDHDHDDHVPHAAADHLTEIATLPSKPVAELTALPLIERVAPRVGMLATCAHDGGPQVVPKPAPPRAQLARGPPEA
jgi:hypothetical protein